MEVRKNFYNIRAARAWNDIPQSVKEKTSVNAFKNAYDRWKEDAKPKWDCAMTKLNEKATLTKMKRYDVIRTHIGAKKTMSSLDAGCMVRP